jgi:hypothetical protein
VLRDAGREGGGEVKVIALLRGAVVLLLPALVGGCGVDSAEAPACNASMPGRAQFLKDPAFAALKYHKRVEYDVTRGVGYDVWGDSRFDYRVSLEFTLVPTKGARNDDDLCAQAVSLRVALPAHEDARPSLEAFVRAAAARDSLDARKLAGQLAELMAGGAKYRLVAHQGAVSIDAGRVSHPVRGEFFVASFTWASP